MAKTAKKTARKAPAKKAARALQAKAPVRKVANPAAMIASLYAEVRMSEANRAIFEAALKGKMPPAPDFTANTHAPYRAKLDAIKALVKAQDVPGLRAMVINPTSTSPKAMLKFRDWSVLALSAKPAKKG